MGMGVQLNKEEKLSYNIRAKRAFPLTANGLVGMYLNGRCNFGDGFKQRKARGAVELAWGIFDFQKEQDVRIKFGYDISNQVPYFQIRENNWTMNADVHGKWNVRFDL